MESLWAILKECRPAAGKCVNTSHQLIGEQAALPSGFWQKRDNFHSFLCSAAFLFILVKKI
jgi:hypothetical protein